MKTIEQALIIAGPISQVPGQKLNLQELSKLNHYARALRRWSGAAAKHFLTPSGIEFTFEAADAIDEEPAVQMVYLVLQGYGEKSFGFDFHFFLIFVERHDFNLSGTTHLGRKVNHA